MGHPTNVKLISPHGASQQLCLIMHAQQVGHVTKHGTRATSLFHDVVTIQTGSVCLHHIHCSVQVTSPANTLLKAMPYFLCQQVAEAACWPCQIQLLLLHAGGRNRWRLHPWVPIDVRLLTTALLGAGAYYYYSPYGRPAGGRKIGSPHSKEPEPQQLDDPEGRNSALTPWVYCRGQIKIFCILHRYSLFDDFAAYPAQPFIAAAAAAAITWLVACQHK